MLENLTGRLTGVVKKITGRGSLTEDNIKDALRDVRMALLEADVALPVVKAFTDTVKTRAMGMDVMQSVSPGQAFVKVIHKELVAAMGDANAALNLNVSPPAVFLVAGLQGAGKTTTVAKLAKRLKERENKKVMVASCDVYRPAAMQQLQTLAHSIGVESFPITPKLQPIEIATDAVAMAKKAFFDVLLIDTAGRLHVDTEMMTEICKLHTAITPIETLFVVDSMTGQDAANAARAFNNALPLTGVILTKLDGDARGGAALSVRQITGKPIKFMGTGEKMDALEPFHPDRIASRILGMGDVLTLVEQAEQKLDVRKAEQMAKKLRKGETFDFEDLRDQLMQLDQLGGMGGLLDKLPGVGQLSQQVKQQALHSVDSQRMVAMINSMTLRERRFPELIKKGSRKKRIAAGSGTQIQDVNRLLKQHTQMKKVMKKMSGIGVRKMMRNMGGMLSGSGFSPLK